MMVQLHHCCSMPCVFQAHIVQRHSMVFTHSALRHSVSQVACCVHSCLHHPAIAGLKCWPAILHPRRKSSAWISLVVLAWVHTVILFAAGVGIRRACVLVGSQKTLPIAVTVLNGLAPQIGGSVGLAVIPCVVSHLVQIVMDSMLVSQWLKQDADKPGARSSLKSA